MTILYATMLLLLVNRQNEQPQLKEVQLCDNYHAAAWENETVVPGQVFSVRYHVTAAGRLGTEFKVLVEFLDEQGKRILQSENVVRQMTSTRADDFWSFVNIVVPAAEPGKYEIKITINALGEDIKLEKSRKLTVEPAKLAFFVSSLTHDAQGVAAASPRHLLLFQPATMRLGICGLKVVDSKLHLVATRQLLSADGKVIDELRLPDHEEIALLPPGQMTGCSHVAFNVTMNHPGEYRLRFIVEDVHAKATITKEVAVRFLSPGGP